MMENFWLALINACRNDTTASVGLKALTGDTDNVRHIGRGIVPTSPVYPYLGTFDDEDRAAIADCYTGYKRTLVRFECINNGPVKDNELIAIKIADRLEHLLHQHNKNQNLQWWNISNSNILNHWTKFDRREESVYDANNKIWIIKVFGEFWWHLKNPPSLP